MLTQNKEFYIMNMNGCYRTVKYDEITHAWILQWKLNLEKPVIQNHYSVLLSSLNFGLSIEKFVKES